METAPLKIFATAARIQLLREVTARFNIVLAPSSTARVEALDAVKALERAIEAEGGGPVGQKAVADQVAYMWFNRVIALRFMDANGYTGIGIVSPEAGTTNAQPEILTQAKLGQIDSKVLDAKLLARVSGLLNGTIRSEDSQNEAYAILLLGYCRLWNKAMPFMFEKEGDFTELLIPSNLLSEDSVIAITLKTLTNEICSDVEVIGWLYQFYISERKDEVFESFKNNVKAGPDELPAATQLFTPDWIVRYLLQNSLGRLWLCNHPDSNLASKMEFYFPPVENESEFLRIEAPNELKVVDPACGSGHMLTYAFDLLYNIYEEEGYSTSEIPRLILTNNLFGIEIDPRAGALAAFALAMKARSKQRNFFTIGIEPNICVLQSIKFSPEELSELMTPQGHRLEEEDYLKQFENANTYGSLIIPNSYTSTELEKHIENLDVNTLLGSNLYERAKQIILQAQYLSSRYNVVVANPPYMGSKNMDAKMNDYAKRNFPESKSDLFAMFIERNLDLVVSRGYVAMITMQSWMFLSSYQSLRASILSQHFLAELAHLGTNAFDTIGGDIVSTAAFIVVRDAPSHKVGNFIKLVEGRSESEKILKLRDVIGGSAPNCQFHVASGDFKKIPSEPIAYWLPKVAIDVYGRGKKLGEVAPGQPGLQTSNNAMFVRYWFEVEFIQIGLGVVNDFEASESHCRWFPYLKGGEFRKWYGNEFFVVDWENNGQRIKTFVNERYPYLNGNIDYVVKDRGNYFKRLISYTKISSGTFPARASDHGFIFDVAGSAIFPTEIDYELVLGFLCSALGELFIRAQNPTINVQSGDVANLPYDPELISPYREAIILSVRSLIDLFRKDWNATELSWSFQRLELLDLSFSTGSNKLTLEKTIQLSISNNHKDVEEARTLEERVNYLYSNAYGFDDGLDCTVEINEISLRKLTTSHLVLDYLSYAVGCMFGRYSLDTPGLVLASQSGSLSDFLNRVPEPTFWPDKDNVIPIVDGGWFEDDISLRFREFLKASHGSENFLENLNFIQEIVGKDIRKYFVMDFYKDHVQKYRKRPIYWLFSSKQGSFNALIYMHRYNANTVSIVLNEYLREFEAKLKAELANQERINMSSQTSREKMRADKEAERIRKILMEISEYERDVLYPLATRQLVIDLDDGVKVNYSKFGSALKNIPGFGASDE